MIELLTVEEAAEELRISRSSMYRLLREKRIGFVLVHGKRMLTREQITQFVTDSTVAPDAVSA